MNDINLLFKKEDSSRLLKKALSITKAASYLFPGIILIFAVVLFILKLGSPLPGLKEEETRLATQLDLLKEPYGKIFILHDRLGNIEEIVSERIDYVGNINIILDNTPSDVAIESLAITDVDLRMTASSFSLLSIDTMLNNMTNLAKEKKIFTSVTLKSMSLNEGSGRFFATIDGKRQ